MTGASETQGPEVCSSKGTDSLAITFPSGPSSPTDSANIYKELRVTRFVLIILTNSGNTYHLLALFQALPTSFLILITPAR